MTRTNVMASSRPQAVDRAITRSGSSRARRGLVILPVVLALGLARPAWAVEALPVLIAIGLSVPALTIARLNRRAERDV